MLEVERSHYLTLKAKLLEEHPGEFALVIGPELVGVYPTYADAYTAGLRKIGSGPMLIREIVEDDDEPDTVPVLSWGLLDARY